MTANDNIDSKDVDLYVIARFAQWAGDFDECQRLLKQFAPQTKYGGFPPTFAGPIEIMRYAGALRARQVAQKKGEFSKAVNTFDAKMTHQPKVISTRHLRATIWHVGFRQFQMRGYLTDLEWEDTLVRNARGLIEVGDVDDDSPSAAGTWTMHGHPFTLVSFSDRALIQAELFWTEGGPPNTIEPIVDRFKDVLSALDGSPGPVQSPSLVHRP